MKKDNEKINKIKELYNKYKEAKRDPKKRAGMKLLGYFIFFFIILLIAAISNNIKQTNITTNTKTTTTTTTKAVDKYVEKQNKLLIDKYNINYVIKYNEKEYKINGNIENNIINGYLEDNNIKKIIIKNNEIYEISNNLENIINVDFNKEYINLENILNEVKKTSAFIQEKDGIKTYLYEFDTKKIYIKCNEENIINIKVEENSNIYTMNFDN